MIIEDKTITIKYPVTKEPHIEQLDKNNFFNLLKEHKIDLDKVPKTDYKSDPSRHYKKFNILINNLVDNGKFTMSYISSILIEDYFSVNELKLSLDAFNKYTLKDELKNISVQKPKNGRRIFQYDLSENLVKTWESIRDAVEAGYNSAGISRSCNSESSRHKGFIWRYEILK